MNIMLNIDPEFQALIPPLSAEEYQQLEANVLADGCRDPLAVWAGEPPTQRCPKCPPGTPRSRATALVEAQEGAVVWLCGFCDHGERQPWVLLDGHTRYAILTAHGLPFEIREVEGVRTREEAINWIINQQLGRRNLTPEQASYLRGTRYNLEKQTVPNPEGRNQHWGVADHSDPEPPAATRLAMEYGVGEATIKRDGQYAAAVDTLAEALGPEVRHAILTGRSKIPKHQVVQRAKAVRRLKHRLRVEDFSFLHGVESWRQQDALTRLANLPADEHAAVNALLGQPGLPPGEALGWILPHLLGQLPDVRQRVYALHASADARDRWQALREAGGSSLTPPPVSLLKRANLGLQQAVKNVDQCVQLAATAPWAPPLQALVAQVRDLHHQLTQRVEEVRAYYEELTDGPPAREEATGDVGDGDAADEEAPPPSDPRAENR